MTCQTNETDTAMIRQGKNRTPVREIVIHCSATRPSWMHNATSTAKVNEIRDWHVKGNGWRDIGYHWVIDRDGTVKTGRPEDQVGSHTLGHNTGTLGVCLIGGHGSAATDDFLQHFTPEQDKALRALIDNIKRRTPIKRVSGHNEYAAKACPGFTVSKYLGAPK